jgi:hypothetical protein
MMDTYGRPSAKALHGHLTQKQLERIPASVLTPGGRDGLTKFTVNVSVLLAE